MADKQPPDHLAWMSLTSKGYSLYLNRLRKGGRSGISIMFGSAADLLGTAEPQPTPLTGGDALAPKNKEEFEKRALFLAYQARDFCRAFLEQHINRCLSGEFGEPIKEALSAGIPRLDNALKELTCISVYLMMLDQGAQDSIPEWLLNVLGRGLQNTDNVISEPPASQILDSYASLADYSVCHTTAKKVSAQLGLSKFGPAAGEAIHQFLLDGGTDRCRLLTASLEEPFEKILQQLTCGS